MLYSDAYRFVGGQMIGWKDIKTEAAGLYPIVKYTMQHPECFNLSDPKPILRNYFPEFYNGKEELQFTQLVTIIFSKAITEYFESQKIEEYKLNCSKLFFRMLSNFVIKKEKNPTMRRIVSKVFANVYTNSAFGFKSDGLHFGFKELNEKNFSICKFSEKNCIFAETLLEMTAYFNIILENDYIIITPHSQNTQETGKIFNKFETPIPEEILTTYSYIE